MHPHTQIRPLASLSNTAVESSAGDCMRVAARHTAHAVRSSLGDVLDLSLGGARLVTNAVPRSPVDVEFYAMNRAVTVRARVAWSRHTGDGFKVELGLVFNRLTPIQRDAIDALTRGRMHRSLI